MAIDNREASLVTENSAETEATTGQLLEEIRLLQEKYNSIDVKPPSLLTEAEFEEMGEASKKLEQLRLRLSKLQNPEKK